MKKLFDFKTFMLLVTFLVAQFVSVAQLQFSLDKHQSSLSVSGTSTLHDWHMDAENFACEIVANINGDAIVIEDLEFFCEASSVLSDNSIMNNKAHDALKAKKYTRIRFEPGAGNELTRNGKTVSGKLRGTLHMAGNSKAIELAVSGEEQNNGSLLFTGELPLLMSDFDIKAPTALMGTVKTGDAITITYAFRFVVSKDKV